MLMKYYAVLLQIFIKIGFFQRLICNWQTTTLLVVQKKVMILFISSTETKMPASKAFLWYKNPVSSEKLSKDVVIFIDTMLQNIMFLQRIQIARTLFTAQTLYVYRNMLKPKILSDELSR